MKRILLLMFLLLMQYAASSQVIVTKTLTDSTGTTFIKDQEIMYLKTTRTWFVVPDAFQDELKKINEILRDTWTLTDIWAINYSAVNNVRGTNNTFFNIIAVDTMGCRCIALRLSGYVPKDNPFIKTEGEYMFGYFYLTTDLKNLQTMERHYDANQKSGIINIGKGENTPANRAMGNFLYNTISYYNMGWGHICSYLGVMEDHLQDKTSLKRGKWGIIETKDIYGLCDLQSEPLYIPDYIFKSQQRINNKIVYDSTTVDQMMAGYNYYYKVRPVETIDKMILNGNDTFFYLDYIFTDSFSMFVVMESGTHTIVYTHMPTTGRLTPRDFEKLSEAISLVE